MTKEVNTMDNDFSDIETLERWLTWKYMTETLRWGVAKVAYEMRVNERRLLEWVNARASDMNKSLARRTRVRQLEPVTGPNGVPLPGPQTLDRAAGMEVYEYEGELGKLLLQLKKKYPEHNTNPDALPELDIKTVTAMARDQVPMEKMAEAMKVKLDVFRVWYGQNLGPINVELRKLQAQDRFAR
jgi:hypothetical protein